jgi:enamine deaminase RidA (YjgF/YER057c/UK114 family)
MGHSDEDIKRIDSGELVSAAVLHGDILYLSGLTDESGEDHDTYQQTVVTLSELDRYLRHYGSNRERLLRVEIWLADIKDFDAMNRAWIEWLGNSPDLHAPAFRRGWPDRNIA